MPSKRARTQALKSAVSVGLGLNPQGQKPEKASDPSAAEWPDPSRQKVEASSGAESSSGGNARQDLLESYFRRGQLAAVHETPLINRQRYHTGRAFVTACQGLDAFGLSGSRWEPLGQSQSRGSRRTQDGSGAFAALEQQRLRRARAQAHYAHLTAGLPASLLEPLQLLLEPRAVRDKPPVVPDAVRREPTTGAVPAQTPPRLALDRLRMALDSVAMRMMQPAADPTGSGVAAPSAPRRQAATAGTAIRAAHLP